MLLGVDVNSRNDSGSTALFFAAEDCQNDHNAAIEQLLALGADKSIACRSCEHETALEEAQSRSKVRYFKAHEKESCRETVRLLEEA